MNSFSKRSVLLIKIQQLEATIVDLCNAQLKSIALGCSYDINVDKQIKDLTDEMLRATEDLNDHKAPCNTDFKAKDVEI